MHAAADSWRLGHRPALDGLRGVAVALVVITHTVAFLAPNEPTWLRFAGAGLGVDVFFVLSGFLITTLLLEEHHRSGRISIRRFYQRRARRLLPAAFTTLALWCLFRLLVDHIAIKELIRSVVVVLTYSTNYYDTSARQVTLGLGHFWTLAVEEQFYFLGPLILLGLLRSRATPRTIAAGACAIAVAVVAHRTWALSEHSGLDVLSRTDMRCDGLLLGAALSVAWKAGIVRPEKVQPYGMVALIGLLVLAIATPAPVINSAWCSPVIAAAVVLSAVVVTATLDGGSGVGRVLSSRPLRHLGVMSYSLYLWHVPAIVLVREHLPAARLAQIPAAVGLGLTLACASYWLVEAVFRRPRAPHGSAWTSIAADPATPPAYNRPVAPPLLDNQAHL